MKPTLKHITALSVLLIGLTGFAAPSFGQSDTTIPGSNCRGANLNQALKGLVTDQRGIINEADEAFFTVCPMDDPEVVSYGFWSMIATFPSTGGDMTCVLRFTEFTDGSFTAFSLNISTDDGEISPGRAAGVVSFGPQGMTGLTNVSVVCPLDPGEGVEAIFLGE